MSFKPNWASTPGETIQDILDERGLSQAWLAAKMKRPKKTINEIIKGKARLTEQTALQLEKVLGASAEFWMARETTYRIFLARKKIKI